jgi:hypothetical protein
MQPSVPADLQTHPYRCRFIDHDGLTLAGVLPRITR